MPKLPADLPENWTQGQTISPNGTETGLTEQHGYNYLMKQVNHTQTEVNNINTALTDVAQQATVNEINNKIGEESDADTQPTLFGKLAQVKNVLVEKLAEVIEKVSGFDEKIGNTDDTVGSNKAGSVMGKLNTLYSLLMGGSTVFDTPGTFEWTVPAGITRIKVSGCGAGAGAGGACCSKHAQYYRSQTRGGGGGGAGAAIKDQVYEVTPGSKIQIKIGRHGTGGDGLVASSNGLHASDGTDGEATVFGSFITLPGGKKGGGGSSSDDVSNRKGGSAGSAGGVGSNAGLQGFYIYYDDGWYDKGTQNGGKGGSNILGSVGTGGSCLFPNSVEPTEYEKLAKKGGDGKDGYISITWGV